MVDGYFELALCEGDFRFDFECDAFAIFKASRTKLFFFWCDAVWISQIILRHRENRELSEETGMSGSLFCWGAMRHLEGRGNGARCHFFFFDLNARCHLKLLDCATYLLNAFFFFLNNNGKRKFLDFPVVSCPLI